MKVKKILETRLDIQNTNDIYCADYNSKLVNLLKERYNGRCYKSIYILDILRIVRRNTLICKNKVLDGSLYIDITFEVSGIVYEKGDIIHKCKIIQINNNGTMHAKSEYASLIIKNISGAIVFKEFEEIPVIVNVVRYGIFDNEISISAIPLVPIIKKSTIFKIIEQHDKGIKNYNELFDFAELQKNIDSVKNIAKSNKTVYTFFKDLLYPFKKVKTLKVGKSLKIELQSLLELKNGDLVFNPISNLDDDTYLILRGSDTDIKKIESDYTDISIVEIDKSEYIIHLLNEYNKNIDQLLEFLKVYDTQDKIKEKSHIWSLYKILKK